MDLKKLLNMFIHSPEIWNRTGLDSVLRFGILSVGPEVTHLVLLQSIGRGKMVLTLCLWLREEVSEDLFYVTRVSSYSSFNFSFSDIVSE